MKFAVYAPVVGTAYLGEVEADTAEEAIEEALAYAPGVSLCWHCAQQISDPDYDVALVVAEPRY